MSKALAAAVIVAGLGAFTAGDSIAQSNTNARSGVVDQRAGHAVATNGKVTICHIPPGNPANRHTIVVGEAAVSAHLAHGDHLGACGSGGGGVIMPPTGPS